jgi:hypothetical protein
MNDVITLLKKYPKKDLALDFFATMLTFTLLYGCLFFVEPLNELISEWRFG